MNRNSWLRIRDGLPVYLLFLPGSVRRRNLSILTGLLSMVLVTGCDTTRYQATARSPANGALVFDSYQNHRYTSVGTIDGLPYPLPGWSGVEGRFLVDPGTRILGINYRQSSFAEGFIGKYHHAELEVSATLDAGHRYHLKSSATNDCVTVWVQDDQTKEPASLKVSAMTTSEQAPVLLQLLDAWLTNPAMSW